MAAGRPIKRQEDNMVMNLIYNGVGNRRERGIDRENSDTLLLDQQTRKEKFEARCQACKRIRLRVQELRWS